MESKYHNFIWLFFIMAIVIIALISFILTYRMFYAYKIMEFISYSSAILSITLSIFAIQYTYTSNVQIQQQFEKINSVADNIRSTSDNLGLTVQKLDQNLEVILNKLDTIDQSQQQMSSQIDNMNNTVVQNTPSSNYLLPQD